MKFIKYSLLVLLIGSFSSCLKPKNDFAGIREDKGSIVVSITETQYINTDAQNIGFGFGVFTNFSFGAPATEQVKFFSIHVSQPRENKLSGPLVVKIAMTPLSGYDPFPTGAVVIPTEISIPASQEPSFDYPVRFTVNKAGLDPTAHYGARFTITSVNQGVASALDKSVDVIVNEDPSYNNSRYTGLYTAVTTVKDANNVYGITSNSRPFYLLENSPNQLDELDLYQYAFGSANADQIYAANLSTGAQTAIVPVRYVLNATGKVVDVLNARTGVSLSPTFNTDSPNQFTYTSQDNRVLDVSYTVNLTLNGVTRAISIKEKLTYANIQAFY